MRAALLLCIVAACALAVLGQTVTPAEDTYTPAIMTKPAATLKKPIIFDAEAGKPGDVDAPIIGKAPANLTKAVVTEHIYGGVVEFARGRTPGGCRCRKQLPEKYRYDAQYKPKNVTAPTPCGCPPVPAPKPEDKLPPVIARLYPIPVNTTLNATAPCAPPAPVVQKIAPAYYTRYDSPRAIAERAAKLAAAPPCAKNATAPVVPPTITPAFYPTLAERRARRRARRAAKRAAAAAAAKKFF